MSKQGRNKPCSCGSGKKYKKCCLEKDRDVRPELTIERVIEALSFGLQSQGLDVTQVRLLNNDTFIADFISTAKGSVDVKSEIGLSIAFMHSFFRENPLVRHPVKFLAGQALSPDQQPLLYAISSLDAAEHLSNGRSIEWLQNTVFEENTQEHRHGIAKRRIAELENGLRVLICQVLQNVAGNDWWNQCVSSKIRKATEKMYENQEGVPSTDGNTLIDFTFLLNLRTIIVRNWSDFDHVFTGETAFSDALENLNQIRRLEAHNRDLSVDHLNELDAIYGILMGDIAQFVPDAASRFLVENWQTRLRDIFQAAQDTKVIITPGSPLLVAIEGMQRQIEWYQDIETRVDSIVVPPGKRALHVELLSILGRQRSSQQEMIVAAESVNIAAVETAQQRHDAACVAMRDFSEKYLMSEL